MLTKCIRAVKSQFLNGHERSLLAKKNIVFSILIKGMSILISLMMVPLTLNYLSQKQYGVWLTLSSVLGWMMFFDIGLGNGLRNKFAEARSNNDSQLAKIYVSTSYAILSIITIGIILVFFIVNPLLNWSKLLNVDGIVQNELTNTVVLVFVFFSMQFVFRLISTIITADQRLAISNMLNLLSSILSLLIMFFLTKTTGGSLLNVGVVFSASPVVVFFIASLVLFQTRYKDVCPSFSCVRFVYMKDLMTLGFQFFAIQMSGLVLFSTTNIIISQMFGPAEVVPYNIANKYYSIVLMIFTLITGPLLCAFTDAYHRRDYEWIKNVVRKTNYLWVLFFIGLIIMFFASNFMFKIWLGPEIKIPFLLSFLICMYTAYSTWATIYATFISGVGKVKLAYYFGIVNTILYIPLAILFGKFLGIEGLILAMIVLTLPGLYWLPLQYKKIINNTAKGIWDS